MSEKKCRGKTSDGKNCAINVVNNSSWCIFHHPNKTEDLMEIFEQELHVEMERQKKIHPEYYDFTEFHFPNEISFDEQEVPGIRAQKATFHQNVRIFAPFVNSIIDFRFAEFQKGFSMSGCEIRNEVFFIYSKFKGPVFIHDLRLYSRISFFHCEIHDRVIIDSIEWCADQSFEKKFQYRTGGVLRLGDPLFGEHGEMKIRGKIGELNSDLIGGIIFMETILKNIEFVEDIWMREKGNNEGRKIVLDEITIDIDAEQAIELGIQASPDQVIQIYRRLRENFESSKRYSEAGDFYIGEMEVMRKYKRVQSQEYDDFNVTIHELVPEKRRILDPTRILYSIYYYVGCYGESIYKPFFWALFIIVSFMYIRLYELPSSEILKETYSEKLLDSLFAFVQLKSNSTIDYIERIISAPILGILFIALKRTFERK